MTTDQDEQLLDKIAFAGRVTRFVVEPIHTEFFRGSGMSQVTIEIERPALGPNDTPLSLSMATMVSTQGKTLEEIRRIAIVYAQKLLEHSVPLA